MRNMKIVAGPKGLQPGDELTVSGNFCPVLVKRIADIPHSSFSQFFYPSTEWNMAQPFECFCGKPTCKKVITGAKDMPSQLLDGLWLNDHIHELLEEQALLRDNQHHGSGLLRRGITSRELSGEMGGDTVKA